MPRFVIRQHVSERTVDQLGFVVACQEGGGRCIPQSCHYDGDRGCRAQSVAELEQVFVANLRMMNMVTEMFLLLKKLKENDRAMMPMILGSPPNKRRKFCPNRVNPAVDWFQHD
jgi:hypothetical protein